MSNFLIDPKVVGEYLGKPYSLADVKSLKIENPPANFPVEPTFYKPEEIVMIEQERERLYAQLSQNCTAQSSLTKKFTLSAGGPGSGKTTLLENLLNDGDPLLADVVFSDPDERSLKLMHAYLRDIETFGGGLVGMTLSYTKWRWASNYISNSIMNMACCDQFNVLLGTTGTGTAVPIMFANAKREGYRITTLFMAAADTVRVESARIRFEVEKTRYTNDTTIKGKLFYERLPALISGTDDFRLYWRDAANAAPVLAAEGKNGHIFTRNHEALGKFELDLALTKPEVSWQSLAMAYTAK